MGQLVRRYPHAVVGDLHRHRIRPDPLDSNLDVATVLHRGKGVVDDVQEDLLQLASVADDLGRILREVEVDSEVAVAGFLLEKAQNLVQKQIQVDGLPLHVHVLGEAQEAVGDPTAAVGRLEDRLHQANQLLPRRQFLRHREQVLEQAPLLGDDRERVVDLVGYTRTQAPDRRQLVGVFHFVIERAALQIFLARAVDHVGRGTDDHGQDENDGDRQESQQVAAQ